MKDYGGARKKFGREEKNCHYTHFVLNLGLLFKAFFLFVVIPIINFRSVISLLNRFLTLYSKI